MLEPIQAHIAQAALIDLDGTFLVEIGIFLVFAVMLNYLVVRPIVRTQQERRARIQGARIEAESMDLRAAQAYEDYQHQITEARKEALSEQRELRHHAEDRASRAIAKIRDEARRSLDASREVLEEDAQKTRVAMAPQVDVFARLIVQRLLSPSDGGVS